MFASMWHPPPWLICTTGYRARQCGGVTGILDVALDHGDACFCLKAPIVLSTRWSCPRQASS
jgi:hypothetical protein